MSNRSPPRPGAAELAAPLPDRPDAVDGSVPAAKRRLRPRSIILLAIVAALLVALVTGVFHRNIDAQTAAGIADKMLVQYRRNSGEPAVHFAAREGRQWADGWEFRWRYGLCPEVASLRIWISRDGRRASFAEIPDCAPVTGLGVALRRT